MEAPSLSWLFALATVLAVGAASVPAGAFAARHTAAASSDGGDWDCSFAEEPIQLMGELMTMRHVVHPVEQTLTVELTYLDRAWISLGVSPNGTMIGGEVVIALPSLPRGPTNPGKYVMDGETEESVRLLESQTLANASWEQDDTTTTLRYTKLLNEDGEISIDPTSPTTFIFASGGSNNTFGDHGDWVGRKTVDSLHLCQQRNNPTGGGASNGTDDSQGANDGGTTDDAQGAQQPPPSTDDEENNDESGVPVGGALDCSPNGEIKLMGGLLSLSHAADPVRSTITVELRYNGVGWLAVGTSPSGLMEEGEVVIAKPSEPVGLANPGKYRMTGETADAITLLPQQTLLDASFSQDDTKGLTILRFTKYLNETGETEILLDGPNTFIYAAGSSNDFGDHGPLRGSLTLSSLSRCRLATDTNVTSNDDGSGVEVVSSSDADGSAALAVWAAHGILMALAWAVFVPLGIGASVLRHLRPLSEQWFLWHRTGTGLGAVLVTVALALAVYQTDHEGKAHFAGTHAAVGLAIVLGMAVQVAAGIWRPQLQTYAAAPTSPAVLAKPSSKGYGDVKPEDPGFDPSPTDALPDLSCPKTPTRLAFEGLHRLVGAALVGLAWYNGSTGLEELGQSFAASSWNQPAWTRVYWAVVGTVSGTLLTAHLFTSVQLRAATSAKEGADGCRPQKPDDASFSED